MTSNPTSDVELLLASLRANFISHPAYENLSALFDRHVKTRRASQKLGVWREARGIVVVGAPGSGKTTAVSRLIQRYPDLAKPRLDAELAEVIGLQIPSPATLKDVGGSMLEALGYPLERNPTAAVIWRQVRVLLQRRGTLFVHLDEAQDLHSNKSRSAQGNVVNTLKSLMNNKDWPVSLILSGTHELIELVNSDHQLARRVDVVSLDTVSWEADHENFQNILTRYCAKTCLVADEEVLADDFIRRIFHAGANEFGLIVEMMVSAIDEALVAQAERLERSHFARAFHRKTGCIPAFNPFLTDDYMSLDPRRVLPSRIGLVGEGAQ